MRTLLLTFSASGPEPGFLNVRNKRQSASLAQEHEKQASTDYSNVLHHDEDEHSHGHGEEEEEETAHKHDYHAHGHGHGVHCGEEEEERADVHGEKYCYSGELNVHLCSSVYHSLKKENFCRLGGSMGSVEVWLTAAASVLVISLCGIFGVLVIPIMQKVFYQHLIQFLVALAVGTLSGDALLHLLPHAIMNGLDMNHKEVCYYSTCIPGFQAVMSCIGSLFSGRLKTLKEMRFGGHSSLWWLFLSSSSWRESSTFWAR